MKLQHCFIDANKVADTLADMGRTTTTMQTQMLFIPIPLLARLLNFDNGLGTEMRIVKTGWAKQQASLFYSYGSLSLFFWVFFGSTVFPIDKSYTY